MHELNETNKYGHFYIHTYKKLKNSFFFSLNLYSLRKICTYSITHRDIRAKIFPFLYEDGPGLSWVSNDRQHIP